MTDTAPAPTTEQADPITPPSHTFALAAPVEVPRLPKVFIALCTRDWQTEAHTSESVRNLGRVCNCEITVRYMMNDGVARARNNLAAAFLESDCDVLFFLDNDIMTEPRHFDRTALFLARMVDSFTKGVTSIKRGIVCALYPKKQATLEWVVNWLPDETPDADGYTKVKHAGTGAMAISRECLQGMIDAKVIEEYHGDPSPEAKRWDLFPMHAENGRYLSEDWKFCEMARAAGWDVWVDTRSQLRHIGKIVYPLQFTLSDEEVVDIVKWRYGIEPDLIRTFIASGQKQPGLMGGHREHQVRLWPVEYPVSDLHQGDVMAGCYDMPYHVEEQGKEFAIIDIGADVGAFARWAAKRWAKCPIHSYEWRPELLPHLECTANAIADRHGLKPTVYAGEVRAPDMAGLPVADVIKIDAPGLERELVEALVASGRVTEFACIMVKYSDELTAYFLGTMLNATHVKHCAQRFTESTGILKFLRRDKP